MDDDTGTSVVLVNSENGIAQVNRLLPFCDIVVSDYGDVRRTNPAVYRSSPPHLNRGKFFKCILMGADFDMMVDRLLKRSIWHRMASFLKRMMRKVVNK